MALVIDREIAPSIPQDEVADRTQPAPATPTAHGPVGAKPLPGFGRCFLLATVISIVAIMATSVMAWSVYRGEFLPGLGLAAYLGFWFGPAAGLIGGGTYWSTKHALH